MGSTENGLFQISGSGESKEINIKKLFLKYLKYWYLFVIGVILSLIAAFLHIRYNIAAPEYYISSTLLIKDDSNTGFSGGISGAMGSSGINKNIGNEMVILRSKNLMKRVLSELNMNTSFFVEGKFQDVEVFQDDLPISLVINYLDSSAFGKSIKIRFLDNNDFGLIEYDEFGEEVSSNHKFGQVIKKPYAVFTVVGSSDIQFSKDIIVRFHNVSKLAESYSYKLSIGLESEEANVLRLGLNDVLPQRSVLILDKLVEVYNNETIEDKNQVQLNTIEFLDERIEFLSTELSDVEKNVEQYKRQNQLTDVGSNAQIYLQTASDYNKQLGGYELQLDIIRSLEEYVSQDELKLVPSSLNIQDLTLNSLIGKYNELQLERQRMLKTAQSSSSLILNIDDQLSNLRTNIQENLRNIKNGLIITRDNLKLSSSQFQSKIRQVPSIERDLLEINRQQSIKQAIYLFLLQRREEAGLTLAATTAHSRIIDAATAGGYPINANKKSSIYMAAILFGIFLPFSIIYLRDFLNDKVTDRTEVERLTDMPILGEIFRSDNKKSLQITEGNHSVIAETFRLVRANLHFACIGKENKVILVTSGFSGEGKTFFSVNLGSSLALSGKRVVILGFDLRRPNLFNHLGFTGQMGITDYLISKDSSVDSLLIPIEEVSGLYAISAGTIPPNPAELMMSPKVKNLIDELSLRFDHIVVDSCPVGQVADTFNLAPFADSSIYIVRYNYSNKSELSLIQEIYRTNKLNHPMIVLNDAKKGNVQRYGYGYGDNNGKKKSKSNKVV